MYIPYHMHTTLFFLCIIVAFFFGFRWFGILTLSDGRFNRQILFTSIQISIITVRAKRCQGHLVFLMGFRILIRSLYWNSLSSPWLHVIPLAIWCVRDGFTNAGVILWNGPEEHGKIERLLIKQSTTKYNKLQQKNDLYAYVLGSAVHILF